MNFENADLSYAEFDRTLISGTCTMENATLLGVFMANFDLSDPGIIQMLSKANLSGANWDAAEEYRDIFEGLQTDA